jgi:hypothetical protein
MGLYPETDKPTPLGCLVGVFALAALAFSVLCFVLAWKSSGSGGEDAVVRKFIILGIIGLVVAVIGFIGTRKLLGDTISNGPPPDRGGLS